MRVKPNKDSSYITDGIVGQKGDIHMYFIAFFAIILLAVFMVSFTATGIGGLVYFIDMPSLVILLLICIPILLASNMWKDFHHALQIVFGKEKEYTLLELKRAAEAVTLVMKTLLYGGFFAFFFSIPILLHGLMDVSKLGPSLAVAVLTVVYALALELLLLPIQARLKIKMAEFMEK